MFLAEQKNESGFHKIILKDPSSDTYAEIIPECGAILHKYVTRTQEGLMNVIESYGSSEDFAAHAESKGFLGLKLSPYVCRLEKGTYRHQGRQYTFGNYYLGNHSIHGILYRKPFTLLNTAAGMDSASVSMEYPYRSDEPGYPFQYDCRVTWELLPDRRLSVTTECLNQSEVSIPMQDGWHPYFSLKDPVDSLDLCFHSREMVEFNSELIPSGNLIPYRVYDSFKKIGDMNLDNCFTVNWESEAPKCILRNRSRHIQVEILPEQSYPYLQIYIPPHRKSIAIENISGAPNGFNNQMGVRILEPGGKAVYKTTYRLALI
ncbi:MAG: aldose 1-epimerase [Bacteroidota bacterium]|nr:aldose 1-epimerase [Bacteroidota bacterium]